MNTEPPAPTAFTSTTLADVIETLNQQYPESRAAEWDRVGLVTGHPHQTVRTVLLAVDASAPVIAEAVRRGVDLLVTHHPLLLRGVTTVREDTPKGRALVSLIRAGIALYTAHTNADISERGVNTSLAAALGLVEPRPLVPDAADPSIGLGRVGRLPAPLTLREFAELAAERLPATSAGVRVSGPATARVETVAVCGGAGDSLFDVVRRSGADVYLTSDLRHHPATEARDHDPSQRPYLVDVAHFASEWPWLPSCRDYLHERLPHLDVQVSTAISDAWTFSIDQTPAPDDHAYPRG
ncbi:Nif3-like dinuclear metal center hexameric protein [Micrococcales bacterium 31B]|nr:Nif3-like dinuclear metal center hexameric protein [Micrococcales bacterium 31B]